MPEQPINPTDLTALSGQIKHWAVELGFNHCAITDTELGEHETHLLNWLDIPELKNYREVIFDRNNIPHSVSNTLKISKALICIPKYGLYVGSLQQNTNVLLYPKTFKQRLETTLEYKNFRMSKF